MAMLSMSSVDLAGKRVLIREDFNVPIKNGKISDDTRLRAGAPTVKAAAEAGAKVLVMSHLGRPKEGVPDPAASLAPLAEALAKLVGRPVRFAAEWIDGVDVAAEYGIRAVIQPGGSKRDDEVIAAADEHGMAMVFTGMRHFRH